MIKSLTDWNGLMIAALAKASRVLDYDEYSEAAEKAVEFIFSKLVDKKEIYYIGLEMVKPLFRLRLMITHFLFGDCLNCTKLLLKLNI